MGVNSQDCQVERMINYVSQIECAARINNRIIITGDANLCSEKWNGENYLKKKISGPLLECLAQSGIKIADIGPTFQADHALPDGNVAESSIDHVYYSANLEEEIKWEKLATSSSDHVPVLTSLKISPNNKTYIKRIKKRSMKNFTTEKWLEVLAAKQWNKDEFESDDVEDLATNFDKNIED